MNDLTKWEKNKSILSRSGGNTLFAIPLSDAQGTAPLHL